MSNDGDRGSDRDPDPPFSFEIFSPFNFSMGPGMGPGRVISIQFPSNSRSERRNAALEAILSNIMAGRGADDFGDEAFDPLSYIAARSFAMAMNEVNTRPVHQSVVDELKKIDITQKHVDDGATCPVCLDDFEVGEEDVYALPCDHMFHKESCLLPWLKSHNNCPVCRKEFLAARNGPSSGNAAREETPAPVNAESSTDAEEGRATAGRMPDEDRHTNVNLGLNLLRMLGLHVPEREGEGERPRFSFRTTVERVVQPPPSGSGIDAASANNTSEVNTSTADGGRGNDAPVHDPDTIFRRSAPHQIRLGVRTADPLRQTIRILQERSAQNTNATTAASATEERFAPEPVRSRMHNATQAEPVVIQVGPMGGESATNADGSPMQSQSRSFAEQPSQEGTSVPSAGTPENDTPEARSPIDFFVQLAQSFLPRGINASSGPTPVPPTRPAEQRRAPAEAHPRMAFPPFPFFFPMHEPPQEMPFSPPQPVFRPPLSREMRVTEDGFLEDDILRAIAASLEDSGPSSDHADQESSSPSTAANQRESPSRPDGARSNPSNVLRISRANLPQSDTPVIELATPQPTPVPTSAIDLTTPGQNMEFDEDDAESIVVGESDEEEIVSIPLSRTYTRSTRPRIFVTPRTTHVAQVSNEASAPADLLPNVPMNVSHSGYAADVESQSPREDQVDRFPARSPLLETQPVSGSPVVPTQSGAGGSDSDNSQDSSYTHVSNKRERDELQAMETETLQTSEPSEVTINKGYVVGSNNSRTRTDVAQSTLDAVRNAIREDDALQPSRMASSSVAGGYPANHHQLSGFQHSSVPDLEPRHPVVSGSVSVTAGANGESAQSREYQPSTSGMQFDNFSSAASTTMNAQGETLQNSSSVSEVSLPSSTYSSNFQFPDPQPANSFRSSTVVRRQIGEEKESTQTLHSAAAASPLRSDDHSHSAAPSPSVSVSSNSPLVETPGAELHNDEDKTGSCITRTGGSLMNRISDSMSPLVDRLKFRFGRKRR